MQLRPSLYRSFLILSMVRDPSLVTLGSYTLQSLGLSSLQVQAYRRYSVGGLESSVG